MKHRDLSLMNMNAGQSFTKKLEKNPGCKPGNKIQEGLLVKSWGAEVVVELNCLAFKDKPETTGKKGRNCKRESRTTS